MASLLSEIPFASLLAYAPQGSSELSKKSQRVRQAIKRGDPTVLERVVQRLTESRESWVAEYFDPEAVLVPVPGSSPRKDPGSLWVPLDLCNALVAHGLASRVEPLLVRRFAVPKSAFSAPEERPKPSLHFESFAVATSMFPPRRVTLVDDVVTRGATLLAATSRIREVFPQCEVRSFAVLRTLSKQEVDAILDPRCGTIAYHAVSDSSRRVP